MKKLLIISLAFAGLTLNSCSISKKIDKTAKTGILKDPAFVPAFTGISIYEPARGKYWYNHLEDKYFVPASNTKIVSIYAAMKHLGDSIEGIKYRVINDSTVVIRSTGDPTFLHPDYENQPVFDFLKKFKNIQIERPVFSRFMGTGWAWGDYMEYYSAQRSAMPIYGNVVNVKTTGQNKLTISPSYFNQKSTFTGNIQNGFSVFKPWDANEFTFNPGTTKLKNIPFKPDNNTLLELLKDTLNSNITFIEDAGVTDKIIYSQPLDSMLKPLMYRSDNFFAEQTLLLVSDKLFGYLNERSVIDSLLKSDLKSLPLYPRWADGSGLSRYNHFSPRDFIAILLKMKEEIGMDRIKTIFATGGTGTISSYYLEDAGFIYAKTGTLNGVVALSGFLTTKKNKELIFSVLVNHHNTESTDIRKGVEQFIQNLRNHY